MDRKAYIIPAATVFAVESPELMNDQIDAGDSDDVGSALSGSYDEGGTTDFEWGKSPWEEETSW